MSAETVQVELGDRSYPVRIGAGLRHEALAVADRRLAAGQRCAALTSPGVAAAQPAFVAELGKRMPVLVTTADGETAKSAGNSRVSGISSRPKASRATARSSRSAGA